MKALLIVLVFFFFSSQLTYANTTIVVNTNDVGVGSLRDAIANSNNKDTIRFDPNILALGNDTINLASTINLNKNLVIIGLYNSSAALYISGEGSSQIFNADLSSVSNPTPKDLTLDSLRFINGNYSYGGAIKFKGFHLNVSNSIFSNNTSTNGGAIASSESYGVVRINNCSFSLNSAINGLGGSLYSGGEVIVIDSDFSNSEAKKGGAIFSARKMSIENCTFNDNTATEEGGAVSLSSNTSTYYSPFLVTNSTFDNNSADFGGAIYTYFYNTEVDLIIDQSTFDNNHSVWSGGAILASSYWYKSSIDINNSQITNNTSDNAGAGIHCQTVYKNATIIADSCLVDSNVADGIGGGISILTSTDVSTPADTAYLHITNSTITNNSASKGGGLSCQGTGGASGSSVLEVDNSVISGNTATIDGGGIYNFASANNDLGSYPSIAITRINYSTINNNQAGENGGGIYSNSYSAASSASSESLIFVNQSTFVNNTAIDDGGAIGNYSRNNGFLSFNAGISVEVNNATIYNNNAANGGAISSKFSSYWSASDVGSMAVQLSSSIIAFNGSSNIYAADSIVSFGYNIFSEDSIDGSVATDQMEVDSVALSLGTLQLNGGFTPSLLPSITSLAINSGNPVDVTDAQNAPVSGIRDVGSTEFVTVMDVVECDSFVSPSGNTTYYTSGFYTDTVMGSGADSLVYINLSINKSFSTLTETICAGNTYISPKGNLYTVSSNFIDTIPNHLSCDSIISISLVVLNGSSSSIDTIACANYTSPSGVLYEIAGVYNDTILNALGCDSVITINLSFGNTNSSIIEVECSQYTSPSGNTYDTSGIYMDTIPNSLGCDSIITIDLSINNSFSSIQESTCYNYTSPSGNVFDSTGIYLDTIPNYLGCDSVITINLSVNYSESSIIDSACFNYTSPSGKTFDSTGIYVDTIPNSFGCDSVVTIDLYITKIDTTLDFSISIDGDSFPFTSQSADIFQWLDCDDNFAAIIGENDSLIEQTGNFAVEISLNGCIDTSICGQGSYSEILELENLNIQLYPNPSNGEFTILSKDRKIDKVLIYNAIGQSILTKQNFITTKIELNTGIYFVEITQSNHRVVKKLVIE